MTDIHIDDFYKDVAKTLLQLYLFFPRPATLYVEDISGPDEVDEFGLHSTRHQACFSAMVWLAHSGYLRFADTIRQEALDQVVLTQKAFTLLCTRSTLPGDQEDENGLGQWPASVIEETQSNINRLREALRSGSSIKIRKCIQFLLTESRHHH